MGQASGNRSELWRSCRVERRGVTPLGSAPETSAARDLALISATTIGQRVSCESVMRKFEAAIQKLKAAYGDPGRKLNQKLFDSLHRDSSAIATINRTRSKKLSIDHPNDISDYLAVHPRRKE
jgi:hypothetical protein